MDESTHFGEYGGIVKRAFKGGGKEWKSGDKLSAKDVESWPLQNRIGLANIGKIRWYEEPANNKPKSKSKVKTGKPLGRPKRKSRKRVRS